MEKYQKVYRSDYEQWYRDNVNYREKVKNAPGRLKYHLMPETGWLNDPNGLCEKDGTYHIYYQYTPFEPTGEIKLWGHYTTKDFIRYEDRGPFLFPDHDYDAHGVYSGSAFVENGVIHYFYTGNIKLFDRDDYDYITAGRGSNTLHFTSRDGDAAGAKELIFTNGDYPQDVSCHVRDPKVFKKNGAYYMVLGARDREDRGLVLLYRSDDLKNWKYNSRITTKEPFGYMWECPDLFELDGQMCMISCPQGVGAQGIDYRNVHQCTVMPLGCDFERNSFEIEEEKIRMVDRGFDFYAPQTFCDGKGRRILIGWMGIPDAEYKNPTVEDGWQHALTLPRELHMKDGKLIQTPIEELNLLRGEERCYESREKLNEACEEQLVFEAEIYFNSCNDILCDDTVIELRKGTELIYSHTAGLLTLSLKEGGYGRTERSVKVDELKNLRIYSDTTSLEIFVNGGEEVFTTRVYGKKGGFSIKGGCSAKVRIYRLNSFIIDRGPGRPESEEQKGLCAIGEALIDFIPERKGQRLKDVAAFKRAAGGAPANVAGAVSRLGLPARLLTKTGNDAFGDYLIESFNSAGIDTSFIKRDSTKETPLAFVSLADDGNRDFQFYRKNSADLFYSPEDLTPEVLDGCGILHFGSVDLVESPMKQAHRKLLCMAAEKGIMISFDPNLRPSLWDDDVKLKETVLEFMPQADIVKISEEELEFITGKTEIREALPELLQGKTRCVLYTCGKDGAAAYTEEWSVSRPGLRVEARDTTGAGDSFTGAFLSRLLSYGITDITEVSAGQMEEFLDFANAYAARTTTVEGGLTAMASKQEFDEWMRRK